MNGEYVRIGKAINKEVFIKLNIAINNIGTFPKNIEIVIVLWVTYVDDGAVVFVLKNSSEIVSIKLKNI